MWSRLPKPENVAAFMEGLMLALRYTLGESVVSHSKVRPTGSLLSSREERQNQSCVLISAGSEKELAVGRVGKMFWNTRFTEFFLGRKHLSTQMGQGFLA